MTFVRFDTISGASVRFDTKWALCCAGKEVEGEYHIHEPGGNVRTVKYHADPHGGFFAEVHNHGGNDHSGGTYGHKH